MSSSRTWIRTLLNLSLAVMPLHLAAANCSGVGAWSASTTYGVGAKATYGGRLYEAVASTTNVPPSYCAACGWWKDLGACDGTGGGTGGGTATCKAAPAVPSGLRASSITSSGLQLNWSAVTPPANCSVTYHVYRNGTKILTVPTTGANITGLAAGTSYSFAVASADAAGTSAKSAALAVKTTASTCSYPSWVAGRAYGVGDIVKYAANGKFYKCTNANPGYDPTISTWFWSPFACSGGGGNDGGTGATYTGYASYNFYDGIPATSTFCNLSPTAYGMMVTAFRTDLAQAYESKYGRTPCGRKVKVTNTATGASVTLTIIDRSNDYSNNGGKRYLDLSAQAFDAIGNRDLGSIPVTFTILD